VFQSTPFARRETKSCGYPNGNLYVSIHSLRKKGDDSRSSAVVGMVKFQSTPFARRETICQLTGSDRRGSVSIHSLRKKGDMYADDAGKMGLLVSIHSLRKKGDDNQTQRRTMGRVSIHSLRKKGDYTVKDADGIPTCFNPLPSQEGRPFQAY